MQSPLRHLNYTQKGALGDVLDDEGPLEDVSRGSGFGKTHHSNDVSLTEQMRQNQAIMMQIAASLANVNNRLNKFERIDSSQLKKSESVSNLRQEPHDLSLSDVSECENESRNFAFTAFDNISVVDRTADDLGSENLGFEDLSQFFSTDEQVGPRILEPLSEVIDSRLRAHISEESMKLLWDKYPRPENCKNLIVPRINNELWPNYQNL